MVNDMKKAILVVSFGTLHKETCERTIGAIEEDLARAFPERRMYRAWTSNLIIKKLREQFGVHCDTVEEALQRMKEDGITDVLVQPTHLLDGFENKRLEGILQEYAADFEAVSLGRPILDSGDDLARLAEVIVSEIYSANVTESRTALVLMGHGSANDPEANEVYHDLQDCLAGFGLPEIVIGTVEGSPSLEDALARLERAGETTGGFVRAILTPLMIVAGNHAVNDMAGEQDDSWENILRRNGFDVTTVIKGLGEYPGVRNILIVHAVNAQPLSVTESIID